MIITRYITRETFKSQLAILVILLMIFFCQKLIKVLGSAIAGEIPISLVLSLMWLGVPEMAQLILPLSLFLGLLMTMSKLYNDNEIIVMYACGFSKVMLVKAAMILSLFTGILAYVNVIWIKPLSSFYQEKILAEAKANPSMVLLTAKQFQQVNDSNSVIFIENVNGSSFNDIFFAQLRPKDNSRSSIIVAESGQITILKDGSYILKLNKGTRFEGTAMLRDFYITNFHNYQAIIGHHKIALDSRDTEQMGIFTLINTSTNSAKAELHWRITLVFTVFMMSLMVIPLSIVSLHHSRLLSILPAMLLYLVFFLIQTAIKSNGYKGKIEPIVWTWTVNGLYLLLAIGLNLWDTVFMRRLCGKLKSKGIA